MVYGYAECVQMLNAFLVYCVGTCMVVYLDQVL